MLSIQIVHQIANTGKRPMKIPTMSDIIQDLLSHLVRSADPYVKGKSVMTNSLTLEDVDRSRHIHTELSKNLLSLSLHFLVHTDSHRGSGHLLISFSKQGHSHIYVYCKDNRYIFDSIQLEKVQNL